CKKEMSQTENPGNGRPLSTFATKVKADLFNALFTRSAGGGWTGGDIAYSIKLPNNQVLWPMGDTFIDNVHAPDGTHPTRYHTNAGLLSSTIAVTSGVGTTAPTWVSTLYKVSGGYPIPYFDAAGGGVRRWCKDGVYNSNTNKIYMAIYRNHQGPGGPLDIINDGTDWAEINYDAPNYTVNQIQLRNTNSAIIYGSTVVRHVDSIYIFGAETANGYVFMHIARVPASNPMAAWQYYHGPTTGWNATATGSYRIKTAASKNLTGISTEYRVFRREGRFYLIAQQPAFLSPAIGRWRTAINAKITGPYVDSVKLFDAPLPSGALLNNGTWTTPAPPDTTWTYSAKAYPEFKRAASGADTADLLVSYNVNNMNLNKVIANADLYRPIFHWIKGWK
ncbi:MAG: hypothetical protein ABIN95_08700, partial [Mucilaginibacter sp.]